MTDKPHVHCFNIGDDGIGKCKCGATKEWPKVKITPLSKMQRTYIENFETSYAPWMHHASLPGHEELYNDVAPSGGNY